MTKPLRALVELCIKQLGSPKKILEIGSRQAINQNELADLRSLFPNAKYVGLDMQEGPGVDMVASAEKLPFQDSSFDLVLCLETLEHAEHPWLITSEIQRVVKKNGFVIVSSQQNFPIHLHPSDYFRFTPFELKSLFPKIENNLVVTISPPYENEVKLNPEQVVFVGTKDIKRKFVGGLKTKLRKNVALISGHKPYRHRLQSWWKFIVRGFNEIKFRLEIEFF